jgi:hypothetical protein
MNLSVFRGNWENSGIGVRIIGTSLNRDGGAGFSRAVKVLISATWPSGIFEGIKREVARRTPDVVNCLPIVTDGH